MKPSYTEIHSGVCVNLSVTSLIEAAVKVGPAFVFDLYCSNRELLWVRGFLRDLSCQVRNNPFAPFVNLIPCDEFAAAEWCLTKQNQSWGYGSKGV